LEKDNWRKENLGNFMDASPTKLVLAEAPSVFKTGILKALQQ
jgi:hypothetical protein